MSIRATRTLATLCLSTAVLLAAGGAQAQSRDQIRIVGSSTVFPFATAVAENFGRTTEYPTPIIESTGSGGGLKLFCQGVGVQHPDITNASRRIKKSEFENCDENGVDEITEVKIGYDGIVIANSDEAEQQNLSLKEVYLALAKQVPDPEGGEKLVSNPYQSWNEINSELPNYEIEVLGPPPTSGTRDAFVELAMEAGCKQFDWIKAMEDEDEGKFKRVCHTMREDGRFIEAGENDVLIVQKLVANPKAFGIFGFSFLDQNRDKIQGSAIDGVSPTFDTIADGSYPISRSLFFYVKDAHAGVIPGMKEYIEEFTSPDTWGPYGYLADKGLIPLPEDMREKMREQALNLEPLEISEL